MIFDVTMGCIDKAEIREVSGLYMLDKLSKKFGKENVGLYQDGSRFDGSCKRAGCGKSKKTLPNVHLK